jgi:hypothetical protein
MVEYQPHVNVNSRDSIIRWLTWNDPNGCYRDDDCVYEGLPLLTHIAALECYLVALEGE